MKRAILLMVGVLLVGVSAQGPPPVTLSDILTHQYGERVEWVIDGGRITYWNVMSGAETPRPTAAQVTAWLADDVLTAAVRAGDRNRWRPTVDAMCAELGCDASAVWAAAQIPE